MTSHKPHIALHLLASVLTAFAALCLWSCDTTKHVPDGKLMLDDVTVKILDKENAARGNVTSLEMGNYLRQIENHEVLGGLKLQLWFYNLSGSDTTKWFNRWARRMGSPPVIFDSTLTVGSAEQLGKALSNKGYLNNRVEPVVHLDSAHKKARVTYNLLLNEPYYISSISYHVPDDALRAIVFADTTSLPAQRGSLLDYDMLNNEREIITQRLRDHGYAAFERDNITFTADTVAGSKAVELTLNTPELDNAAARLHNRLFKVRQVKVYYTPQAMRDSANATFLPYNGLLIADDDDPYLRQSVIDECCYIRPGELYKAYDVSNTYRAFSRLDIVKFVNINPQQVGEDPETGTQLLDVTIVLSKGMKQGFSFSLEGTNSEGDLGFGVGFDYQHRNVMRGSEKLNAKFRYSHESLSGNLGGLINDHYSEWATEVGIVYPKFKFPLISSDFKRRVQASTELHANFNYQQRPEYTRIIAGGGWKYVWNERQNTSRHVLDLVDINYVYLPKSRDNFLDSISNPLLRYSYEDHLIMRLGYTFSHSNKPSNSLLTGAYQPSIYSFRASAETAGNLLYAFSNATQQHRDEGDAYKVFGIRYAQYVKVDFNYSYTRNFNYRNSLAMRVGAGVAVPYGNSSVVPFEKRFYSGGANSVRGWGVRSLGPGSFYGLNLQNSFIYQCGDIRFDANIEFRSKLFWVFEMGAFIDAGNVWTIRDYDDQPGGVFKFNKFYEQIALAYGLGLRMNFTYFLVRLDLGMKAFDPGTFKERWPAFSPKFSRDAQFHFSVGYPF